MKPAPLLLCGSLSILLLAGCCSKRTVTVPGETPPPTIVTVTDTVRLAVPPPPVIRTDTLVLRDTVVITRPVEVVRYIEERDPDEPQYRLFGFHAEDGTITFYGPKSDVRVKLPVRGEELHGAAAGPDSLTFALSGTPAKEPDTEVQIDVEEALIPKTPFGYFLAFGLLALGAVVGGIGIALVSFASRP